MTNVVVFVATSGKSLSQTSWYAPTQMVATTPNGPHSLATASGLLLGTMVAAMAAGALVGWALGAGGMGLLIGALIGIPAAVFVVYKVYS